MKRVMIAAAVGCVAMIAIAADSVEPATATYNSIRGEAVATISGGPFYDGSTLLFTNNTAFSDTAGSVTQGLDGITVTVTVGNTTSSSNYTATTYADGAGVTNQFWASITVPTNIGGTISVQTKLVDGGGTTYIYPWKSIQHQDSL